MIFRNDDLEVKKYSSQLFFWQFFLLQLACLNLLFLVIFLNEFWWIFVENCPFHYFRSISDVFKVFIISVKLILVLHFLLNHFFLMFCFYSFLIGLANVYVLIFKAPAFYLLLLHISNSLHCGFILICFFCFPLVCLFSKFWNYFLDSFISFILMTVIKSFEFSECTNWMPKFLVCTYFLYCTCFVFIFPYLPSIYSGEDTSIFISNMFCYSPIVTNSCCYLFLETKCIISEFGTYYNHKNLLPKPRIHLMLAGLTINYF